MTQIQQFEDIVAWQKAKSLAIDVYAIFRPIKDYSFKDQIQRAAVSVMNNIAEGFERKSNKEFKHFLFISKGSCGEVRSLIRLARELGYISEKNSETVVELCLEISRMLSGFIKKL
ncbi:four helix bundle protein [soil metagenome]